MGMPLPPHLARPEAAVQNQQNRPQSQPQQGGQPQPHNHNNSFIIKENSIIIEYTKLLNQFLVHTFIVFYFLAKVKYTKCLRIVFFLTNYKYTVFNYFIYLFIYLFILYN